MENKLQNTNLLVNTINQLTKRDLIFIVVILLLIGFIAFLMVSPDTTPTQDVDTSIDVNVPGKKSKSDTVYYPVPVLRDTTIYKTNPLDHELYQRFISMQNTYKDSIAKLNMYLDAITQRQYKITYPDSTQRITVFSEVQGKLLKQHVEYEIFPQTIKVDTVIQVKVKPERKLFALVELGAPLQIKQSQFVGKGTMIFKNKKDQLFSLGIDTEAMIWGGFGVKF